METISMIETKYEHIYEGSYYETDHDGKKTTS